jgi:hypothetical protein
MVRTKSLFFQLLYERDHKEPVRKYGAVFILPDQMADKSLSAAPGLRPCFRLAPHICEPLNPAD